MTVPGTPRTWLALIMAAAAVALCIRLGFWQLERADAKIRWQQEVSERQQREYASVADLLAQEDPGNYPVRLSGEPDNAHTILLDNRIHEGIAGYHVLTPVRTDAGPWVLLNRGWWPRGPRRDQLPGIAALPGRISVPGLTYRYSDKVFTLAEDDLSSPQWPLRVQRVDTEELGDLLGIELAPFEVRAEPGAQLESGEQMVREWTGGMMTPDRHKAYALQWFAMAFALALLLLLAALRQRRKPDREMDA